MFHIKQFPVEVIYKNMRIKANYFCQQGQILDRLYCMLVIYLFVKWLIIQDLGHESWVPCTSPSDSPFMVLR